MRVKFALLLALAGWLCPGGGQGRAQSPSGGPNASSGRTNRTILESFQASPRERGWQNFGDPGLFQWNPQEEALDVTWDSSQPNSYLVLPLRTILTRRDDFSLALDLTLSDIKVGVNPSKPGTFQIAFGFQNQADAARTNFHRGTSDRCPNLVEFNYLPDAGYGPTIWPAVFSTNGLMNYSGNGDFSIFPLPIGQTVRITLSYRAATETASISMTLDGVAFGPVTKAPLAANFRGFRLDALAIASYSDDGQSGFMPGSILAQGRIDNLTVSLPPPPMDLIQGAPVSDGWEVAFTTTRDWDYQLESSEDLIHWSPVSEAAAGSGSMLRLRDDRVPKDLRRFYRVNAVRPD